MNYLRSFLEAKKRAEGPLPPTDKTDKTPCVSFVSESPTRSSGPLSPKQTPRAAEAPEPEPNCYTEQGRAWMPLRPCGALVCRTCGAHSPPPHREGCPAPRFDPCRSRWFWLSPHRAIKCIACTAPADLGLVEAWVLARETGEGEDGCGIPTEILSLLRTVSMPQ